MGCECPYTNISLRCFLMPILLKLCQILDFPALIGYLVALTLPSLVYQAIMTLGKHHITLAPHSEPKHNSVAGGHTHSHTRETTLMVIAISLILGTIACIGLNYTVISTTPQHFIPLGYYLFLLSCFHFGEYFVTSLTNPSTLSCGSFLLNQTSAYELAVLASFVEYFLEAYLYDGFKQFSYISLIGLVLAICGDLARKIAMFTAGLNFSHHISNAKTSDHWLVTGGIYSYMRHPSYAGWFYWAIGTQLLLLNPVCFVAFYILSYRFFKERIEYEEYTLDRFWPEYKEYRRKVGTWLPIKLEYDH